MAKYVVGLEIEAFAVIEADSAEEAGEKVYSSGLATKFTDQIGDEYVYMAMCGIADDEPYEAPEHLLTPP